MDPVTWKEYLHLTETEEVSRSPFEKSVYIPSREDFELAFPELANGLAVKLTDEGDEHGAAMGEGQTVAKGNDSVKKEGTLSSKKCVETFQPITKTTSRMYNQSPSLAQDKKTRRKIMKAKICKRFNDKRKHFSFIDTDRLRAQVKIFDKLETIIANDKNVTIDVIKTEWAKIASLRLKDRF